MNIGTTTPVGNYPEGATPEGLYDMAGNVLEWMENWYNEYGHTAARGTSYASIKDYNLRCSFRTNYYYRRSLRNDHFGFRVVRSSPLPEARAI